MTEIFSEYGSILEIVAKTNLKAKGQAFIVFDNVDSATRAIDEVNGFELFEKPMVLEYAKTRSDATVMREGGDEELEVHKRRRLAEKGAHFISGREVDDTRSSFDPVLTLILSIVRTQASTGSSRSSEEIKTPCWCSRCSWRARFPSSKDSQGSWTQAYRCSCSTSYSRRILATKQDLVLKGTARDV